MTQITLNPSKFDGATLEAYRFLVDRGVIKEVKDDLIPHFGGLDYYTFKYLIETGKIRGQDIISLCQSSTKFSEYCSRDHEKIYRELLIRDFRFRYEELKVSISPGKLYRLFAKYQEAVVELDGNVENLKLWWEYYPDFLVLIREHYPPIYAPSWVNYPKFQREMLSWMTRDFLDNYDVTVDSGISLIHFGNSLAFAYTSEYTSSGDFLDAASTLSAATIDLEI